MRLPRGYHALQRLPEEKVTDQITRRVLTGDKGMIVWWSMKAGAHAAAHHHDVGVIPGGVEHEAWFPENTEVVDIFSPPREDFLTGEAPAYMRKG